MAVAMTAICRAVLLAPLNVAIPRQTGELRSTKVMDKRDIIFSEQAPEL